MKTVTLHLPARFLEDDLPSCRLPALGSTQLWAQHSQEKQSDAFAQQMSVGGKISGKIALNVPAVQRESSQPLFAQAWQPGCSFEQTVRPETGRASERGLQAARRIDTDGIRIPRPPVPPLPEDLVGVALVVGQ